MKYQLQTRAHPAILVDGNTAFKQSINAINSLLTKSPGAIQSFPVSTFFKLKRNKLGKQSTKKLATQTERTIMKLTKLASLAVMATVALGAISAKATIGTVTNYDKLSFSIQVKTNKASVTVGSVTKYPVGTAKFTTKDLLNLFTNAEWANTNFPVGAQIVVGWDNGTNTYGKVLVVDKTGTNILYVVPSSGSENFDIEFDYESGDYTETYNSADPGFDTWDETYMYYVQLEDDAISLYIWGYPTGTQKFDQKWDMNGNYTTWSDSESIDLSGGLGGDQEVNGNTHGSASGDVKLSGKGKGVNSYWY